MSTSVSVKNVTKKFGDFAANDHVNLEIEAGEFVSLLGPSGCGKTTLLSMILGIQDPTEGDILFGEQKIDEIPIHKRDVGMVFQNYALFPHMTVFDNVAFGLKMRKVPKAQIAEQVKEALAMVHLEELGSRYPRELSGGQQQRVALARAIVVKPRVLLLDEPLSNLDAKLREEMRFELKRLYRTLGITTIYVTHDQIEALSLSTKIAVMKQGVVQQYGSPLEIFLTPANDFVADFVGYTNFLCGKIEKITDGVATVLDQKYGYRMQADLSNAGCMEDFAVGDLVSLSIKPESVQIIDEKSKPPVENILSVEVLENDYTGVVTRYQLQTPEGFRLTGSDMGYSSHAIGQKLYAFFPPSKMAVIKMMEGAVQ